MNGYISSDDIAEQYENAQLVLLLSPPEQKDSAFSARTSSKAKPTTGSLQSSGKHSHRTNIEDENIKVPSLFMFHSADTTWNLTDPGTCM